jgi:hypothetical protein
MLPPTGLEKKRPNLLTILCILTFIGSGLNFISGLMFFVFYDSFMRLVPEIVKIFRMPEMQKFFDTTPPAYYAATAAISAIAVTGAIRMWKMRKQGFHIYAISQILIILAPMYFLRLPVPDFFSILVSGAFILMYSSNLKKMS